MARTLSERDAAVVWHPYTQAGLDPAAIGIVGGRGAVLLGEDGREYIDAISSWWVNLHGHGHPLIAEAIARQAAKLEHVIFAGMTHEPAVELAERLVTSGTILRLEGAGSEHGGRVFYSDNGSTAVEAAIKIAVQYWRNVEGEKTKRTKILTLEGGYHGDTVGAMSLAGRGEFNRAFERLMFEVVTLPTPLETDAPDVRAGKTARAMRLIEEAGGEIAAFVYEPVLQAAGGMRVQDTTAMGALQEAVRDAGGLLIADEVMTGFGRTGHTFASAWLDQLADITCLSKGLTGGAMALGATVVTRTVHDAFVSERRERAFLHGHSYTANPIACAAGVASFDMLKRTLTVRRLKEIEAWQNEFAETLREREGVRDVRVVGTVLAFDVTKDGEAGYFSSVRDRFMKLALERGVLLRPLGNVVYVMPPYCLELEQMRRVQEVILEGLDVIVGKRGGT